MCNHITEEILTRHARVVAEASKINNCFNANCNKIKGDSENENAYMHLILSFFFRGGGGCIFFPDKIPIKFVTGYKELENNMTYRFIFNAF